MKLSSCLFPALSQSINQTTKFNWQSFYQQCAAVLTMLVLFFSAAAQNYRSPLDLPLSMSANFAELRPNHFHAGIDFRVGGAAGAKLYAVQDGYIARVYVSPSGYGKALYIKHPDGITSVYAHMDNFAGAIGSYVKDLQYKLQRFTIDEYLEAGQLPVKKGDVIGFAGNTGSSFGAHLHFELRNSDNQAPINPITKGYYKTNDDLAPQPARIAVYTLDSIDDVLKARLLKTDAVKVTKPNNYALAKEKILLVQNPFYFAIKANDVQPNNHSKHGVNQLKAFIDDKPFFAFKLDEFEFKDTRYLNSLIAYEELYNNKQTCIKTYVEPGNTLPIYKQMKGNGLLWLKDTLKHKINIDFYDDNGNKSTLSFMVKKSNEVKKKTQLNPAEYITLRWNDTFNYYDRHLQVSLPEQSLYSNTLFNVKKDSSKVGAYSYLWTIGNKSVPLQKKMAVKIKLIGLPQKLYNKALVVRHEQNGRLSACGGELTDNGFISAQVSDFGTYSIAIDTIPPKVTMKAKTSDFSKLKSLSVTISDNLSGIASYAGYIDDKWILFEYDAKNSVLNYTFDPERVKRGTKHKFKLEVADYCGNKTSMLKDIIW